jgi:hypothetical protein
MPAHRRQDACAPIQIKLRKASSIPMMVACSLKIKTAGMDAGAPQARCLRSHSDQTAQSLFNSDDGGLLAQN